MGLRRFWGVLLLLVVVVAGCGGSTPAPSQPAPVAKPAPPPAAAATGAAPKAAAAPAEAPARGGTLRVGLQVGINSFDPHKPDGVGVVGQQGSVYETLIGYNAKAELTGALAESWKISDGDRTFEFKLRQGVRFHDGNELTAQDVIASLERIKDPNTKAMRRDSVLPIAKTESPDKYTVRLTLNKPDATFLEQMGAYNLYIVRAADVKSGFDFGKQANGTGAFKLESFKPQGQTVMVRNPQYWQAGLPYLDKLVLTEMRNDAARSSALRSNEQDLINYAPWQDIATLKGSGQYEVATWAAFFNLVRVNTNRAPLNNKLVRQALQYVLDRKEVVTLAWGGQGWPMDGPLQPPGTPFAFKDREGYLKKDWDKAKALLKQAGYDSPGAVPPLEFKVLDMNVHRDTAEVIRQQLANFGLRIEWKTVDFATLVKNRSDGDYTLQMDGQSMTRADPDYLRTYFHSTQGTLHARGAKYKNEKLDALLEQGAATPDASKRQQVYKEAEQLLLDDSPWLFVHWRVSAEAFTNRLQGFPKFQGVAGLYNLSHFKNMWLKK